MNEPAPIELDQAPASQGEDRPWFSVCVTKDNQYLVKPQPKTGAPPARILMPWVDQNDPRMFVRNGELIKPYGIVEFALIRIESCPELDHDRACYKELARADFDPSDCVPINYFSIEQYSEDLNSGPVSENAIGSDPERFSPEVLDRMAKAQADADRVKSASDAPALDAA